MLSEKIDLTENRDFSALHDIDISDLRVRIGNIDYNPIFGIPIDVENDESSIFSKKKEVNCCERCGKSLRIPWKNIYYGLCEKCNSAVVYNNQIPWKMNNTELEMDVDIFSLR